MTGSRLPLPEKPGQSHWLVRAALVATTLATGSRAADGEPSPGRVQAALLYTAPEPCPSSGTFWQGVTSRSRRIEQIAPEHAELIVRVSVRPTTTGFRGELQIVRSGTATDARQVNGSACQDVVDALALTTALGLDPDATVSNDAPPEWDESHVTPRTGDGSTSSPTPSSAPPKESADHQEDGGDKESEDQKDEDEDDVDEGDDEDAANTEPSVPDEGPGRLSLAVGGGWVLAEPVNVGPSIGGAGFIAIIPEHVRFSSPRVDLGFYVVDTGPLAAAANARFLLVTGELRACPVEAAPRDWIHLVPCVAVQAGRLEGSGQVTEPETVQSLWFSLGMAARLSVYLTQALHLELSGAAQFPMMDPQRYNVGMPPTRVAETVAVSAWLTLGLSYVFDL